MSAGEAGFLLLAALAGLLGVLLLTYAVCALVASALGYGDAWRALDGPVVDRGPRPTDDVLRVMGCITCEAAEAVSTDALVRHLIRDHEAAA